MEIRQLQAFRYVAMYDSFSKAAAALLLTQPTVSARIQALEQEIGEALFERRSRGVRLTEAGKAFLPYAERCLQAAEEGQQMVRLSRRGTLGKLHLGAARTIGTYVLPKLLQPFMEKHPDAEIAIKTGRSQQVLEMILTDDIEVGFARQLQHPEVESIHLYEEAIVLVTHPRHAFARRGHASIADIAKQPLILYDRESTYYVIITNVCREAGIVPQVTMELDSIEATKKMVELGLGISLLPISSLERELKLGTLVHVDVSDRVDIKLPTALLYRKTRVPRGIVKAFLEDVRAMYQAPEREPAIAN